MTGVPHPRFLRVGVLVWNAKGTEAPLRARPSSFSDVQLLPAVAVAGECASKKLVRQGTAQGSARVWVPTGGLRGDAESCASVDRRAKEGHAVDSVADAQATRLSEDEAEREGGAKGATFSEISEVHHRAAAVLAAAVLRFQRVQPQEEEEKLEYMHANPVVRGLVKHPKDWPWSSFSFYAKEEAGLAEIDLINM